jgi:hypothetical protein
VDWISHGVLPEETSGEPPRWIWPHLYGRGSDEVYLAVRGDSLRIAGYTDQGVWHAFRGAGDLHLVPPAVPPKRLSFDDDYTSLLGGHERLKDLRISKESALDAITELARPRAANRTADDVAVRRAVATLNVAMVETQRFRSIRDSVIATWENGGTTLSDRQVELVADGNWKTMSCALLISEQNGGAWLSEEAVRLRSIGMFSKEDVLREIDLIMWPKDCSEVITLAFG